jgi:hypothetical protein
MSFHGRSLDDLPLAAYSSGLDPEELDEPEPEPAHPPMDARAAALSIVEPEVTAPPGTVAKRKRGRPALPRLPRLPSLRRERPAAEPQDTRVVVHPQVSTVSTEPQEPKVAALPQYKRVVAAPPQEPSGFARPAPERQKSRWAARRPLLLAGGVILGGIVVAVIIFGGGWTAGGLLPSATASAAPTVAPPPPGAASLTLSGAIAGKYDLTGTTGFGRPSGDRLASTWTDALRSSLTLTGQASTGTRPTGPDLALTWTVVIDGAAVTFTSRSGECVVGMAVKPTMVSGSIVCEELTSADGKVVIEVTGTYHT